MADSEKKAQIISQNDLQENARADIVLASIFGISRSQILKNLKNGSILVNGKGIKASQILKIGDCVEFFQNLNSENLQDSENLATQKPEFNDIKIIYEDDEILIINKPPNIVIHEAPSLNEPTLTHWLKSRNFQNLDSENLQNIRFGIVHRLDRNTSGALAIAKSLNSHANLSEQLKKRTMGRYYIALIDNALKEPQIIERYMARNPKNRLKMSAFKLENSASFGVRFSNARYSKSEFMPLLDSEKYPQVQLIAVKLFTGRTHQIRAHLESINRHIFGDELYGFKNSHFSESNFSESKILQTPAPRVALHAYLMYLQHPKMYNKRLFLAPILRDMQDILHHFFDKDKLDEVLRQEHILRLFGDLDSGGF